MTCAIAYHLKRGDHLVHSRSGVDARGSTSSRSAEPPACCRLSMGQVASLSRCCESDIELAVRAGKLAERILTSSFAQRRARNGDSFQRKLDGARLPCGNNLPVSLNVCFQYVQGSRNAVVHEHVDELRDRDAFLCAMKEIERYSTFHMVFFDTTSSLFLAPPILYHWSPPKSSPHGLQQQLSPAPPSPSAEVVELLSYTAEKRVMCNVHGKLRWTRFMRHDAKSDTYSCLPHEQCGSRFGPGS